MLIIEEGVETLAEPLRVRFDPPPKAAWEEVQKALRGGLLIGRVYDVSHLFREGPNDLYTLFGRTGQYSSRIFVEVRAKTANLA